MSTRNFHNVNASRVYAKFFPVRYYCLDCDFEAENLQDLNKHGDDKQHNTRESDEQLDCEDWQECLQEELLSLPEARPIEETQKDTSELRSYPSTASVTLEMNKQYNSGVLKDCVVNAYLTVVIRSGYYDGCNLDYILDAGGDCDCLPDKQQKQVDKWIAGAHKKLAKKAEKIFAKYTTPLRVKGVFSNGEAVYEKAT